MMVMLSSLVDKLSGFSFNEAPPDAAFSEWLSPLNHVLPHDYLQFMHEKNGGEGFVGSSYLVLWKIEDLKQFNAEYEVAKYAPGLLLFGADGGGEGFAFDTRVSPPTIVMVPQIGMELRYATPIAADFSGFIDCLLAQ
jgi:hypothetical protein